MSLYLGKVTDKTKAKLILDIIAEKRELKNRMIESVRKYFGPVCPTCKKIDSEYCSNAFHILKPLKK